ncbi:TonB-dependent receptor [Flavobacterium johnsoniae]|uniref:TonB-dependent receptor n=1 Tax=Flavobacterium johnsoniae (strain ATCC 17061 / DSM 2064 / JCM 8514 / BCRC 14874 / CCUG 350202 / NBRC 14942 / NCIMB 11054 / UW101) TaxID=376686 RepID=A5FMW0_FLAJ1|nr:TonB-dependent receptor [Flavobacterium johnsoniae]ABQ03459.1 TonB-dependent receptor [Flavobacterium johnsoniae UW101]OXG01126.1 TonB-dependent receptor [Flavobacterium johnsoniae UW101]WQG79677.1 TonB-dependent receptor [Flavobacterium johnsoniae UW101]SHL74533.1 iron complex outermembrane recepter protein [Flavobacterium johnsoniae]
MILKKYCFLVFVLFVFQNIEAQKKGSKTIDSLKTEKLKEVVISSLHINNSLLNTPASIGILSKKDLLQNNTTDITTVINTIPGVFMQSSNFTTSRISIRGIGARTTYGTNKIRAFYGSIPLTSGNSETVIDDIDLENLNQIEIIKGPLSSVYGAGLGGAILISPQLSNNGNQSAGISTVFGSFGLLKNSLNFGLDEKSGSLNISYHNLKTDGWRENSSYNREGITLAGELFRKENSKLTYFSNYTYLKAFIPSSISKEVFNTNPKAGAPTWVASKGYKEYKSVLGGLAYDFNINENLKNSTSVFINYKDSNEPRPFDILRQYTFATGARTQFSGNFKIGRVENQFIAGAEYFTDTYSGNTFQNLYQQNNGLGSLQGNQLTETDQKRHFYNIFSQLRTLLSDQLEIQAGLNYNKTRFDLNNYTENINEEYSYDGIFSPQISFLYKPHSLKTLYFSVSRGFSLPATEETLTSEGKINPDIKPENGYNFEVGGKFYFFNKRLYTEISLYRMEIKDLLVAKRVGDDQYVGANAGKTFHEGIEITLNHNWPINRFLVLNSYLAGSIGNYKFKEFIDSGNDFSGNKLTGVAPQKINAGITLNTNIGVYFSTDYQFVGEIQLNDANTAYSDSYTILNLKTGYRFEILRGLTSHISAGVNNVTNEKYASLILPNAVPTGNSSPRYYYPGLPVNYYGAVSLNYLF